MSSNSSGVLLAGSIEYNGTVWFNLKEDIDYRLFVDLEKFCKIIISTVTTANSPDEFTRTPEEFDLKKLKITVFEDNIPVAELSQEKIFPEITQGTLLPEIYDNLFTHLLRELTKSANTANRELKKVPGVEVSQEISDEVDKLWAQMFRESLSLKEFIHPILEESQHYYIVYYESPDGWTITVYDSEDNKIDSLDCKSVLDRDVELEYLKKDYNTQDVKEAPELLESKKKNKKGLGWFSNMQGDPEKNVEIFNHAMGSDTTADAMSEDFESPYLAETDELIKRIHDLGYNYNLTDKTPAQLYRILQRCEENPRTAKTEIKDDRYDNKEWVTSYNGYDIFQLDNGSVYVPGLGEFESIDIAQQSIDEQ